jgi:hypothetical protein
MVDCSLCTCKSMEERRKGETHTRTRSPYLTGAGHGMAMDADAQRARE